MSSWSPVSPAASLGGSIPFTPLSKLADLGWDTTHFNLNVSQVVDAFGTIRSVATTDITPESVFDGFSTARSAPAQTYYVATTGNDSTGDGTSGKPYLSIWKAIAAANSAGTPTKIIVSAGTYYRVNNPWYNGGSGVFPTVDIALIADGGRVVTGCFDSFSALSFDSTLTNCQILTVSSADRVLDMANLDKYGNYTELKKIPGTGSGVGALCNATPNSWFLGTGTNGGTSGTLYINRADKAQATTSNTRVMRPASNTLRITSEINVYIGGTNAGDGFDMEGAQGGGVLHYNISAPGSTRHVCVARDSTFKYAGGYTDSSDVRGVSIESLYGLAYFQNCRADANMSDGFNFHNTNSATAMHALTVNCTGFDNGKLTNTSCQGWTSHETVLGIDLAGYYKGNHGSSVRSINTTKSWFVGTIIEDDLGDICNGGTEPPTGFWVDNTAVYYCERTRVILPAGGYAYKADSGTSIYRRNCAPTGLPDYGAGTFATY